MTERTAVRAFEKSPNRDRRWRRVVVEGARQSGRGDVPVLHDVSDLRVALDRYRHGDSLRICCWERAARPLAEAVGGVVAPLRSVVLLVGPEGGLTDDEVRIAEESGFAIVSLGRFVLRTETAVVAALGAITTLVDG